MTKRRNRFEDGLELSASNIEGIGGTDFTREGEIDVDSDDSRLKVRVEAATRTVVTEDQTQTLTNKNINVDNNTVSNIEVDNLKAGVLNVSTTLTGASDVQLPSALAVKTYIDDKTAAQNEASEISFTPTGTVVATDVQAAIAEVSGDIDNHIADITDAHDASAISNVPSGNLAATDVQGALNELQTDINTRATSTALTDHINDTTDAHDASAISSVASGNLAATDVQAALNELQSDVDTRALTTGGSIITPARLDMKQDTYANLVTYATTATDGQLVFATDTEETYVVVNTLLEPVGAGGISAWITAEAYVIDDKIEINNRLYKCLVAHTSGVFATDLAAIKWVRLDNQADDLLGAVPILNGGTGQTTKAAAYDALSPMTTTGDLIYGGVSGTGTRLPIGTESKTLRILSGLPAWGEYDPDNLLVNPSFEDSTLTGWTCTSGTCTSTNTAGEFSSGLRALKVALSASAMNVTQSVATVTGATRQYVIGVNYRVPATMADFQICTLIAGVEKTCVPSANLILDDAFHTIEIPEVITPGSTVGIKFKTTTAYTANAYFDKAYVKQGIGTQALQLDNVYSGQISSTGVLSGVNKTLFSGCTASGGSTPCTIASGIVTSALSCVVSPTSGLISYYVSTSNSTTVVFSNQSGIANASLSYHCQKSGNDYLAASSAVYSQSSANTEWTTFTPTGSWSTNTTYTGNKRFTGDYEEYDILVTTSGAPTSAGLTIDLPSTIDTAKLSSSNLNIEVFGYGTAVDTGVNPYFSIVKYNSTTSVSVYVSNASGTYGVDNQITQALPFSFGSGDLISIRFKVPVVGRSNSSSIVGTFAGTPKVPGLDGNVDTFSVSYGTTNATTNCTASPCSYLDQIGTAVSSITRGSTGVYALNTSKTYSKLKCSVVFASASAPLAHYLGTVNPLACTSCNSIPFGSVNTISGAVLDSTGTLMCQGSY